MTNVSLQNLVTDLVSVVVAAKGLNPDTGVKGGEREMAQAYVGMAIKDNADKILSSIPGMTPELIEKARQEVAAAKVAKKAAKKEKNAVAV